ncbi:hypothetical protein [Streptomyces sp. NBC_01465]|uniref:hypothetical protein n=1 Tax=Streptomyces sp. NBC_01465 TaxID=2903878 RepID=UPI002E351642|nr:hypothetical protein [Streptomyces sp. NBC_01465]
MLAFLIRVLDNICTFVSPRGRHRAGDWWPLPDTAHLAPTSLADRSPYATDSPLDGRATAMVRPYTLSREQRERRRELWLATYGIDVGPRRIHGKQVTA